MSAIIIDTETTGMDDPEPVQIAWTYPMETPRSELEPSIAKLIKPTKPISIGAMATHHIIHEDLVNAEPWSGRFEIPGGVRFIVGHNVDFDWKVIGSPDIKRICTLALSRFVWPNVDSHSLSALIYHIYPHRMARELLRGAHDASVDVDLAYRVLFAILSACPCETWDELYVVSEKARIPTHFTFGKYGPKDGTKGMPVAEVRKIDRGYIGWCLRDCDIVKNDPYWIKALTQ